MMTVAIVARLLLLIIAIIHVTARPEIDIITEPRAGEEYVFVQSSGSAARSISRKEKTTDVSDIPFETAHKIPTKLTHRQEEYIDEPNRAIISKEKREAANAPSPAPPGSIKIDPLKLIEKYRSELEASKNKPRTSIGTTTTTTKKPIRTKKEAPTTFNPILTTGAPATPRTLNIHDGGIVGATSTNSKLVASGSENKRSKIQIKKGANGQEYEYEYVYYYYDDDEDVPSAKAKVINSHDGPQRNSVTNVRGKYNNVDRTSTAHPEPATNEVVPSTRGNRQRGRQLNHDTSSEDKVSEERLPANTRFPPRSRNLATTPSPTEEENTSTKRQRGKPQIADNTPDETQVSGRGRNRSNVRRPSLELVDSASFNTHSSNDPAIEPYKEPKARGEHVKDTAGPSFPSELPDGPVRFLGATPNEKIDLQDIKPQVAEGETSTDYVAEFVAVTEYPETTEMSVMNKAALDLYAFLKETQGSSEENKEETSTDVTDVTTTDIPETTELITEPVTTEEITTSTTTTSTTTQAPSTTTTPEPITERNRFRKRPGVGANRYKSSSSTTSTPELSTESSSKPRGRFNAPRPGFNGRGRPGARTSTEATETEAVKEENKQIGHSKPTAGGRSRFGSRSRLTTKTAGTSEPVTVSSTPKSGLRSRPSFNLRRRGQVSTTAEPIEGEHLAEDDHHDTDTTTIKSIRGRVNGNLARPLRPGPRINIGNRNKPGAATTSTTGSPADHQGDEENSSTDAQQDEEKTSEATLQLPNDSPLNKLRNRAKINVSQSRQKVAASAPVQVRRTNPLLSRRKPVTVTESIDALTETVQIVSETEASPTVESEQSVTTSTTEEPRGLNKLLAGRRRLANRQPGTIL